MPKWEYYWLGFDATTKDMDKIDELGAEGWELINIIKWAGKNFRGFAVLKRESKRLSGIVSPTPDPQKDRQSRRNIPA